jgi:hypothetical protein
MLRETSKLAASEEAVFKQGLPAGRIIGDCFASKSNKLQLIIVL